MKDVNMTNIRCQAYPSEDTQTESINEGKTSGSPSPKRK